MKTKLHFSLLLCILLALTLTGAAQDATGTPDGSSEPSAFLRALSLIPEVDAGEDQRRIFSYADYHATAAMHGITLPANANDRQFMKSGFFSLISSLPHAGPIMIIRYAVLNKHEVGISFIEIAQAIDVGTPTVDSEILIGDFDTADILATYTRNGYVIERETAPGILFCPPEGCGENMGQELSPGNPMTEYIGARVPTFVGEGVLLSSTSTLALEAMLAAYEDSAASLAMKPEYQAVANVLAAYPIVAAVNVDRTEAFRILDPAALDEIPGAAGAMPVIEAQPLPLFSAAAFAAAADEASEYGLAILVYADAASAQEAAGIMDMRLATIVNNPRTGETFAEQLSEVGTLEPAQVVTDEATGLALVIIRLAGTLPEDETGNSYMESQWLFSLLQASTFQPGVSWLTLDNAE